METKIKGIKIFRSSIFKDKRGFFKEIYKAKFINKKFIFHCLSNSKKNVLRGLHIQTKNPQGKFLTIVKGEIFDVVLDLRKNSKTFGKFYKIYLSENSYNSIFIPEGCAHGFCTLQKENIIYYCNTKYRDPEKEVTIKWNDPDLKIKWPIKKPILSEKDNNGISFLKFKKNRY
jgi:dTDP-4-dehydrorhamnose 3,5-epimerase